MAEFSDIVLNTTAERIEIIANMDINSDVIDENSNDGSLPTSKAVYEAIKNIDVSGGGVTADPTYNPESPNAQSGIAVAEAVDANKQYANNTFSAAIKNTVSGLVVSANDVSPIEHNLGVKVSSKNLFDIDKALNTDNWYYYGGSISYPLNLKSGKPYTFSIENLQTLTTNFAIVRKANVSLWEYSQLFAINEKVGKLTYSFVADGTECLWMYASGIGNAAAFQTRINNILLNYTKSLQLELGDTATEYTPYVEPSTVTIRRYGKNLYDLYDEKVISYGGANSFDATSKNDGRLTISSDNKKITTQWHCPIFTLYREKLPKGSYTFSFKCGFENSVPAGAQPNFLTVYLDDVVQDSRFLSDGSHKINFNLEKETTIDLRFYKHIFYASSAGQGSEYASDTIYKADFWDIQLESGKNATEYEEYKQVQEATANADGIVTGLTSISPNMTIMTDNNGANLNVTYNVDTKTYIDNKFAELAQALLNS